MLKKLSIVDNWIFPAKHTKSPNYSNRTDTNDICLLVIHCIALPPKTFFDVNFKNNDISDFFCNNLNYNKHPFYQQIKNLKVSSHLLIKRNGELTQFVGFDKKAWHAGKSNYNGRNNCNNFSIGIELEGADNYFYTDKQYQQLIEVSKTLITKYPNIRNNITGHQNIAPNRKTDPGTFFDWSKYLSQL